MDTDVLYIKELMALFSCRENNGFYRRWAGDWLTEIRCQYNFLNSLKNYPVVVMGCGGACADSLQFENEELKPVTL